MGIIQLIHNSYLILLAVRLQDLGNIIVLYAIYKMVRKKVVLHKYCYLISGLVVVENG
jgi:hypothetical protein